MRVLILGAPSAQVDSWHDDVAAEAVAAGWDVDYRAAIKQTTAEVIRAARGRDMLIWLHAHRHVPRGDARAMLRQVEAAGCVTVGVHMDLYWGLQRESRICRDDWWDCQYVYTADGGERDWAAKGLRAHWWCPPALAARHLGLVAPQGRHRAVFIGSYIRSLHGDHRAKLLAWAKRRWGREFFQFGRTPHDRVYGERLSGILAHANVTLGDAAPAPFYWSDRVVRNLGRGAVFAHPRVEGMVEQGFTDDTVIYFDRYDFDGLAARLDAVTDAERRDRRDAAVAVVEQRHLWRHRLAMFAENAGLT